MAASKGQVHLEFISTGTTTMRKLMEGQPGENQSILMRRLRSITGEWTGSLPIGVFLIHHPDGPILFDTGSSPLCNQPGYISVWNPVIPYLAPITIAPEDGIINQLNQRGVKPEDLQAIVLSHLHHDHVGGLKDLASAAPDVPIYLGSDHWDEFGGHWMHANTQGCTPQHWPENFQPRLMKFEGEPLGPWAGSFSVTKDRRIVAVPTPGHIPGHAALVVFGDDSDGQKTTYILPGDSTYNIERLEREEPDGMTGTPLEAIESMRKMKEFARQQDVVVLPSHDQNTPVLLKERVIYRPQA